NAAVGERLDMIEPWQAAHIDEAAGAAHAALHEIQQVGAGGEIDCTRLACGRDGVGNVRRPDVLKAFHATPLSSPSVRFFCLSSTASVIPAYAPQRQRLPLMPSRMRSMSRPACPSLISPSALMIWPGVQKPHWKPSCAMNAACTGCSASPRATPSMVMTSAPSWLTASARHEL